MAQCNITAKELAKALDIKEEKLYDICDFFDEDPDDDWELIENLHFNWGSHGSRIFSYEGAVEICNFLEENKEQRSVFTNFKRWFLQRDKRLKGLMISKRVEEAITASGQIRWTGDRAFLHPRSCRKILGLGTRQDVLNQAFIKLIRSENTEIESPRKNHDFYVDYVDENRKRGAKHQGSRKKEVIYFSGSGLASIGKQLNVQLTQKHRRDWVELVAIYAPKALAYIEKERVERGKRVTSAMNRVRKAAKNRCQVTNRRKNVNKFDLEVHHLYDRKNYPELADVEANLIAIGSDIHTGFHKWMGGPSKGCTLADFEAYIEEFSSSLFDDISEDKHYEWMMKVKGRLSRSKKALSGYLK